MNKRYRYLVHRRFLNDYFYPRCKIKTRYAILPTLTSTGWIWLQKYYKLKTISTSLVFGGEITIKYSTVNKSVSIFSFKNFLKKERILINLYRRKKENLEGFNKILKKVK